MIGFIFRMDAIISGPKKEAMLREQDPHQFLQDYLSLPDQSFEPVYEPSPPPPVKSWLSVASQPGVRWRASGQGAKASTFQCLKHHILPPLQIHLVTFEDDVGRSWDYLCHVGQDEHGFWHMLATAGSLKGSWRRASPRSPWVHLVGANGESGLWVGGSVTHHASDASLVRLLSRDGHMIEDRVHDGLVVFQTDHPVEGPIRVEVYRRGGKLLGVQSMFGDESNSGTSPLQ